MTQGPTCSDIYLFCHPNKESIGQNCWHSIWYTCWCSILSRMQFHTVQSIQLAASRTACFRAPTHHLLSSVLSQASPLEPLSYSAGAMPGIDTQGCYNSVTMYFKFLFRQTLDNLYTRTLWPHSCFELI